jgi:CheY-like chemotaxis protein
MTVLEATGGKDALAKFETLTPDLVVLDIMMPDINGLEVLAQLKTDPATRHIPVMIVTGYREAAELHVA